ncbi:MAG TPA: hypothetical protein VFH76_17400 [Kribbella sp.]|nr:hypothetical protein [Kribbella sp.]
MRQSLSETPSTLRSKAAPGRGTAMLAVLLSLVLAVAAVIDQGGGQSLFDHAAAGYAAHGKDVTSGTIYGLVYTAAIVNVLMWLLAAALARTPRLVAVGAAGLAVLITLTLGLALLFASEYGVHPFPPVWGILALLPALAGMLACAGFARARR